MGKLRSYRAKRDFRQTAEPAGAVEEQEDQPERRRFVIQEHHARRLHWDLRLEREGTLVSWALPRGIPEDPRRNHLAVHVEDHPLEYGDFEGEIPKGNYGAGQVKIWDRGTYETHKWQMDGPKHEVMVTLHGQRVQGRYVLFQTRDENWMIHRMDPPQDPDREPMPASVSPMLARLSRGIPEPDQGWAYEFKWDGIRAFVLSEGGVVRVQGRGGNDVTSRYPELRGIGAALGSQGAVLDGEIVALGPNGTPRFEELQQRIGVNSDSDVRRRMKDVPVYFMAFDLLYLDGHRLTELPYRERRQRLLDLRLAGANWQTPEHQVGHGAAMLEASRSLGMEGVIAKRLDSPYQEGQRSPAWLKIKNRLSQDLVVGGWMDGEGRRHGSIGALLVGHYDKGRLHYAGRVGSGFTDPMLTRLESLLAPLASERSPFDVGQPPPQAHFVRPELVAEVQFADWTRAGQVRASVFKGLRPDKRPMEVFRERFAS